MLSTLKGFPSEDVAGDTLQAVRESIQEYEAMHARRQKALAEIAALLEKTKDAATRRAVRPLQKEIAADLDFDTLDRMAAFLQNADDAGNAQRRQARPGRQRLAAGARRRDDQAERGDLRWPASAT